MHPWPLNKVLPWKKQREVKQRLASVEWAEKTFDEVLVCLCVSPLNVFFENKMIVNKNQPIFIHSPKDSAYYGKLCGGQLGKVKSVELITIYLTLYNILKKDSSGVKHA